MVTRGRPADGRLTALLLGLVLAGAAALSLWAGRGVVFRGDEWAWLTSARHVTLNSILQDYNGHLLAFTEGFFFVAPTLVGLGHYWVLRGAAVLLHVLLALSFFGLAQRRLNPTPALALTAVVAFLGTGSDAFLSAINIGIVAAMAACLAALLALSRHTRRGDLAASLMLGVGLASFSVAVAFTVGVAAELLWRRDWRRLWTPLMPAAPYVAWRLHRAGLLGGQSGSSGGVAQIVHHALQSATGAISGLVGVQLSSPTVTSHLPWLGSAAEVIVGLLGIALVGWLARHRRPSARLVGLIVSGVALWLLLGTGRGTLGDLYASRYVYQGAIIAALIVVEIIADTAWRPRADRVLVTVAILCVSLNIVWLVVWANFIRRQSDDVKAQLAALDIARARAPAAFRPSTDFTLVALTAGDYFALEAKFGGSPADSLSQLRDASAVARLGADGVLIRALSLHVQRGPRATAGREPSITRTAAAGVARDHGCVRARPTGRLATVALTAGSPGLALRPSAPGLLLVRARRYADTFTPVMGLAFDSAVAIRLPRGRAPQPWQLALSITSPMQICPIR